MSSAEQNTSSDSQELTQEVTQELTQQPVQESVQESVQVQGSVQDPQEAGSDNIVQEVSPVVQTEEVSCATTTSESSTTTTQDASCTSEADHVPPQVTQTPTATSTVTGPATSSEGEDASSVKKVSFDDISLAVVSFNRIFSRNRGTLSQVVKSLSDMHDRLVDPINDYQKGLYPQIRQESVSLVASYERLVSAVDKADYSVFGYYLNGPQNNGKRRTTTTKQEQKSYGVSEYQETLKSIDDRLRHIKIDCIRKTRDTTRTDQDIFERVIKFCDEYHKIVTENLAQWKSFMDAYRRTNGVVVKTPEVAKGSAVENVQDSQSAEKVRRNRRQRRAVRPAESANQSTSETQQGADAGTGVRTNVRSNTRARRPQNGGDQPADLGAEPRTDIRKAREPRESRQKRDQVPSDQVASEKGPVIRQEGRVRVQKTQPLPRPAQFGQSSSGQSTSQQSVHVSNTFAPNSRRVTVNQPRDQSAQSTQPGQNSQQGGRRRFKGASVKSVVSQSAVA
ncbi:hypothetical protein YASMINEVIRUS_993 [Yasminevirus sp. GU-2018]|uniref:Uncharacterized protein n=1 Tax=Yasminevirus sp. GU-2018 TaxID=2420051 RepID=A0A5K0UA08_9VIRU|nr:hypothetical protein YASMINEVIRUS_993 [Yasminevirus sp. GU-2018]